MKARLAALFCLAMMLALFLPQVQATRADSVPAIGIGFGPSDVERIASGIPIFTQGDNLWMESYYNSTVDVELSNPAGNILVPVTPVEPGELFILYGFQGTDLPGVWHLTVTSPSGPSQVPIVLGSPDSSLAPSFSGEALDRNELNQTFSFPATDAYNIQLCTLGASVSNEVGFGLLGGLNGTIEVTLSDNSTLFSAAGIPSSVSAWLELYSQYSYSLSGGGSASQSLLAATTPVASFSPPGGMQALTLAHDLPLRSGRFDLRAFARTSAGLTLHDFQFLRTSGGSWLSLSGCTSQAGVSSQVISLATNLDSANSTWPRELLTMYTMDGVESYTMTAVPGGEAAIHLADFPDGKPLTGVAISASAPGLAATQWDAYNSSVYVLTKGLDTALSLGLSFSGVVTEYVNASVSGLYASKSISVPAGTLVASATSQGSLFPNATISVSSSGSPPAVVGQRPPGTISLLLPPGDYVVSASYASTTVDSPVTVSAGHTSTVSVDLGQTGVPLLEYLLTAVGAAGVVANIFVWRQYLERRKVYG